VDFVISSFEYLVPVHQRITWLIIINGIKCLESVIRELECLLFAVLNVQDIFAECCRVVECISGAVFHNFFFGERF
jgi:hypothetical protein